MEIGGSAGRLEHELFGGGAYRFSFEAEIAGPELTYCRYRTWLRNTQPDRERRLLQKFVGSELHKLAWKQFFQWSNSPKMG